MVVVFIDFSLNVCMIQTHRARKPAPPMIDDDIPQPPVSHRYTYSYIHTHTAHTLTNTHMHDVG